MTVSRDAAYKAVNGLAQWSEREPFAIAAPRAPLAPGVYQMRLRNGVVVYVGTAGERRGQGIRGRLSIYRRGRGAVSGFGEAALDRALANTAFVARHLDDVRAGKPARASVWAQDATRWLDVEVRWSICDSREFALELERAVVNLLLTHEIWNRVATQVDSVRTRGTRTHMGDDIESTAHPDADGGMTVMRLTHELGRDDGGNAVRRNPSRRFSGPCPRHLVGSAHGDSSRIRPLQVAPQGLRARCVGTRYGTAARRGMKAVRVLHNYSTHVVVGPSPLELVSKAHRSRRTTAESSALGTYVHCSNLNDVEEAARSASIRRWAR